MFTESSFAGASLRFDPHGRRDRVGGSRSTVRQRVRQIMSPCCAHRIHASFWKPKIRFTHAISASLRAGQDALFVTRWKDKLQNVYRVTREMPVKYYTSLRPGGITRNVISVHRNYDLCC